MVARSNVLSNSTVNIIFPGIFVFCSWLHIVVSFSFLIDEIEPRDLLFHLLNLFLFAATLICIACSLRDRAARDSL